jgi:hypothetical protein
VTAGFRRAWSQSGKTADQHAAADEPGDGDDVPADDEAALATPAETGSAPGAEGPAGEDVFDDSAIEALAQEADGVAAPF